MPLVGPPDWLSSFMALLAGDSPEVGKAHFTADPGDVTQGTVN